MGDFCTTAATVPVADFAGIDPDSRTVADRLGRTVAGIQHQHLVEVRTIHHRKVVERPECVVLIRAKVALRVAVYPAKVNLPQQSKRVTRESSGSAKVVVSGNTAGTFATSAALRMLSAGRTFAAAVAAPVAVV